MKSRTRNAKLKTFLPSVGGVPQAHDDPLGIMRRCTMNGHVFLCKEQNAYSRNNSLSTCSADWGLALPRVSRIT